MAKKGAPQRSQLLTRGRAEPASVAELATQVEAQKSSPFSSEMMLNGCVHAVDRRFLEMLVAQGL